MNKDIEVSFVIPVYNAEKDLQMCIDSILGQKTNIAFEAILVNDGSKDSSLEILKRNQARDSRLVIVDQPNSGVSKARNAGIENAKGRYVCFVDSDDWIEPNYLEHLYRAVDTNNSCLVIEGCIEETNTGSSERKYSKGEYNTTQFGKLFSERRLNVMGVPWGKIYNLELINKYGIRFDSDLMFCEDFLFMLSYLCYADKVIFIDNTEYHYNRKTTGSLVTKYHSFEKELHGFELEKALFTQLIEKYPELRQYKFWSSFLALRSIKTMYRKGAHKLERKERIKRLQYFNSYDGKLIYEFGFKRNNLLARIIGWLVMHEAIVVIDLFLLFLYSIKSAIK